MLKKVLIRLRNKKIFLSVTSGILLIFVNLGIIDNVMSDKLNELLNIVLSIGVAVGIFSDPESHINKTDNEEESLL